MFNKNTLNHYHFMATLALVLSVLICAGDLWAAGKPPTATADLTGLVLVENGVSRVPIVVFKDAPPFTRRAADELAQYIEKTSGAKPQIIEGDPQPTPAHAIWVGYQPRPPHRPNGSKSGRKSH
jgi:hypothetical protein